MILRAPFAALAQFGSDSTTSQYRLGVFACLFVAALLGLWIARRAAARGTSKWLCLLFALAVLFNPLTFRALDLGHPEEPLAAMLALTAIVAAAERRGVLAGVAFGLALATKQWTLLAAGPLLIVAAPEARRAVLIASIAVAAMLYAPVALGDWGRFNHAATEARAAHFSDATPTNVWWPLAEDVPGSNGTRRQAPKAVNTISHWLVLALALAGSVLVATRMRGRRPTADQALETVLALAALFFLARCLFDPVSRSYHHEPFLLTLLAYEIVGRRRFPYLAAIAGTVLWYLSYKVGPAHPDRLFWVYILWSVPTLLLLAKLGRLARR